MRNAPTAIAILIAAYATGTAFAGIDAALAGEVTISIENVKASDGPLYVSLQTEDQFLQNAGTYGDIIHSPTEGDLSVVLSNVADGEYSVSIWHDINNNQVFDREDNGIPLDGWSMIGAATMQGLPVFDSVKFNVDGDVGVTVEMVYPN